MNDGLPYASIYFLTYQTYALKQSTGVDWTKLLDMKMFFKASAQEMKVFLITMRQYCNCIKLLCVSFGRDD